MKAWAKTYPDNKDVKFLADGSATYTHALGLELDLSEKGLGTRSRRFALLVDDLKVKVANVEAGGEFTVSSADDILKAIWITVSSADDILKAIWILGFYRASCLWAFHPSSFIAASQSFDLIMDLKVFCLK